MQFLRPYPKPTIHVLRNSPGVSDAPYIWGPLAYRIKYKHLRIANTKHQFSPYSLLLCIKPYILTLLKRWQFPEYYCPLLMVLLESTFLTWQPDSPCSLFKIQLKVV